MVNTVELRQKRAKLITDARSAFDLAQKDGREATAEERARWTKMLDDADKMLKEQIEPAERMAAAEASLSEIQERKTNPGQPGAGVPGGDAAASYWEMEARELNSQAHKGTMLRFDAREGHAQSALVRRANPKYGKSFKRYLRDPQTMTHEEYRDLQADADTQGGYLVPTQFAARLIIFVKNLVFVRQQATVIPVIGADGVGIPSLDTDIDDADWTAELLTGNDDAAMAFGKRELKPHPLAKQIKVSNKLLRNSGIDAEALLLDRMSYKFAVTEEKGFLTGTGSQQPLGVFTASANGISTARDVSTGNTTTTIGADNLFEVKYSLKVQYWERARWLWNRTSLKQIAKLKDGEGRYLWMPGLVPGMADQLLGFPFDMSEYAPNTYTTGQYVGILADWSRYYIADNLNMSVQRLVELYAATNQVGFIARKETDGMPVLEEAFVRSKLA
ncbi:MAG: phage major capsid protein [Elusimicrobia bacterium]|nr:phage major capsid protein [Elusimicrobiota bacterium]